VSEHEFHGIGLEELPVVDVDWAHTADKIRSRSQRSPGDFDVADEVVLRRKRRKKP